MLMCLYEWTGLLYQLPSHFCGRGAFISGPMSFCFTYLCHFCSATDPGTGKEPAAQQTPGPKRSSALAGQWEDQLAGRGPHTQRHRQSPTLLCRVHHGQLENTIQPCHVCRAETSFVSQLWLSEEPWCPLFSWFSWCLLPKVWMPSSTVVRSWRACR